MPLTPMPPPSPACRLDHPIPPGAVVCAVGGLGRWPLCGACDAFWGRRRALGEPEAPERERLSRVPVVVVISADYTGRIDMTIRGPVKGRAGLLSLLDAARKIAEATRED